MAGTIAISPGKGSPEMTRMPDDGPARGSGLSTGAREAGDAMRVVMIAVVGAGAVLVAPLLWLWLTVPIVTVERAEPGEAVLVFGAIVRDRTISPLHLERLETGVALWEAGKAQVVVVSNAALAARVMADYLETRGLPPEDIEIDGQATSTPDTCVAEAGRPEARSVLMVSQAYHLPRIALQCRKLGVKGQYVAAIRSEAEAADPDLWTLIRVRGGRHLREAALVWAELLGQYRRLERWVSP